ncbi:hypothetical protein [Nostoc parmelioides]|uniref:hypothetical protein n=1 Tax=Nostoc parmelioides TaxID=1521621 RepID=UPI001F5523A3|nr:hypothetical protein [Nostoc parmelioides]
MMKSRMYRLGLLKALTLTLLLLSSAFVPNVLANQSRKPANWDGTTTLQTILSSSHRQSENRQRDQYRHPAQTLSFFGLRPDMTVVELWPGSGWYTEILAPYLAAKGKLIVTNFAPNDSKIPTAVFQQKLATAFQQKLEANKEVFGKVKVALINPPQELTLAPDNSRTYALTKNFIHVY